MQPQDPRTGDIPQPPAARGPAPVSGVPAAQPPPVAPQPAGKPRSRRKRLWLAMGLGIVALLCLGGVGVFVSLYDGATEIKRSAPDAVADSFLRAYLVNRDDREVSLYTCRSGGDFSAISSLRTELIKREHDFGVTVAVSWSSLAVSGAGESQRTVDTDLVISGRKNGETQSRRTEPWQLGLVQDDGWRVCSARKMT